jgi:hypothetical protein
VLLQHIIGTEPQALTCSGLLSLTCGNSKGRAVVAKDFKLSKKHHQIAVIDL